MVLRIKSVEKNSQGLKVDRVQDILVLPIPRVENVNPKLVDLMYTENIEIGLNDLTMKIIRSFDLPNIADIEFVIVDPVFDDEDRVIDGIKASIVHISDKNTTDYEVVLRRLKDTQSIVSAGVVFRG